MTDNYRERKFEDLPPTDQAKLIIEERTPKKEQVVYQPTVTFLDPQLLLNREERAKVIAMGDRTAISYENLAIMVKEERGKTVVVEGETVDSSTAFFLQYALSARSTTEIAHSSILEQLEPGANIYGGNPPIILEGISVLAGLRDICSLRHFGFEAFSSRGGIFPPDYFRVPDGIANSSIGESLYEATSQVYKEYLSLTEKLLVHYLQTTPRLDDEKLWKYKWRILNLALDDSRQVTNGTFLNHIAVHPNSSLALREGIVQLSSKELPEVKEIADKLRRLGESGLPNLMRHTEVSVFDSKAYEAQKKIMRLLNLSNKGSLRGRQNNAQLLEVEVLNNNPEREFLAAFLSERSTTIIRPSDLSGLDDKEVAQAIATVFEGMTIHDKPPKALERIQTNVSMLWNTGALYEAIRHRFITHTVSKFSIDHGFTIPPVIKQLGLEKDYIRAISLSEKCYEMVEGLGDKYAIYLPYFVTRAHLVGHQMRISATDIFHFLKLRTGPGAHPDIVGPSKDIVNSLQEKAPAIFNHLQLKK